MALILSYFEHTKKYSEEYGDKTIVLMMVGSFYEIYGEKNSKGVISGSKIEDISKICDLAIAQKTGTYVMAGFTYTKIDKYLKKIQDAGYTTIVIKQDPTNPKIRSVEGIYSPGTFFNPDACEISNNTMCIWVERVSYMKNKSVMVGIANVDIYTGRVILFEYKTEDKHNPTSYDELERYISTYKPSEVIFISNFDEKMSTDIMNFAGLYGAASNANANTNACKNIHIVYLEEGEGEGEVEGKRKGAEDEGASTANTANHIFKEKAVKCEKQTYRNEILQKFYKYSIAESIIQYTGEYEYGTQAFIFLLNFLYEHNPNLVNKIREPVFDNKSDRMILANHSLKQLNIIDDDNYTGKYSSVLKFLNNCITPMGMRKFKYKMLNPVFNIEKLNKEYSITEHVLLHGSGGVEMQIMEWRKQMSELKDIEKLHRQLVHQKVNPRSLFHFYNNLKIVADMFDVLQHDKVTTAYIYDELGVSYDIIENNISVMCNNIRNFIASFFDIDKCCNIDNLNFDDNFVLEKVSSKLDDIVYNYENSYIELKTIQMYLDKLISVGEKESKSEKKYEYVKIHDTEKMGYSLVTTKRRAKILEDQVKEQMKKYGKTDMDQDANAGTGNDSRKTIHVNVEYISYKKTKVVLPVKITGITYPVATGSNNAIVSTQINKICDTIIGSKNEMKSEIENIFNDFVKKFQNTFDYQFQKIVDALSIVDNLQNKVYIAIKNKYTKPVICGAGAGAGAGACADVDKESYVKAKDLRHCLIEHINTNEIYVTNDIELGQGTTQDGILLYGTNAVGKTSLIRALGIAVIMAQAGLYVPCSSFEYMPYQSIFTRILGNDNLFKGMSTFMVEMSEMRVILKSANKNALILVDELCSGTEMDSAISIFVAGLKKMHDAKCSFIFATHMHEINKYEEVEALNRMTMKHLEVTYNKETDSLIYDRKLKDGSGFSMYGLEVCKSLHLPDDFLEYANNIRLKYRNNEQSILSLSASRYNTGKLRAVCEMCKIEMGTEIHHLQHQKNADKYDFIGYFHKNHTANLISI